MNNITQDLRLNFLALETEAFEFTVYRKEYNQNEQKENSNVKRYKLPKQLLNSENYTEYWIRLSPSNDYEEFTVKETTNVELTKWYLFSLLSNKIKEENFKTVSDSYEFNKYRIYIKLKEHENIGSECIWLEPYYLKRKNKFGFLIEYQFKKDVNYPFYRKVQQLSLSLDKDGRSNKNFHIDKYEKIRSFLKEHLNKFKQLSETISISSELEKVNSESLYIKQYLFATEQKSNSQFKGLQQYGPYSSVSVNNLQYTFLLRKEHENLANDLIKALNGKSFKTFSGLSQMFRLTNIDKNNVAGIIFSTENELIDEINAYENKNFNNIFIAILSKKESLLYYKLKNAFVRNNIPLQVVHIETINDNNKLKWSVSGIALQIFTKLGGTPWIVQPANQNTLIVGIGQSIRKEQNSIKRYKAYGVLLNSSGQFVSIKSIVNDYHDEEKYLEELAKGINGILNSYSNYQKIVFHIPQKMKMKSIKKIEEALKAYKTNIELTIFLVNNDSKFFAYNFSENSRVPYESSYCQLSSNEFLIWTEGLNYHSKTVSKRYGNPIYVKFYYSNKKITDYKLYLQDILNLSGANYRGFNAKSLPVSIYYPKLLSNYNKHFEELKLNYIMMENNKLWFI